LVLAQPGLTVRPAPPVWWENEAKKRESLAADWRNGYTCSRWGGGGRCAGRRRANRMTFLGIRNI